MERKNTNVQVNKTADFAFASNYVQLGKQVCLKKGD